MRTSLELLAYNEWAGVSVLPEMLAAFVQPNHPDLQPLVARMAGFLEKWTGDPSLDGYQRPDPARVRLVVAAAYATLQSSKVTYVNPPASFEETGQKVRTPEDVVGTRLGTCVDLSVLTAGLLEAVGLHPLLLVVPGHLFAGCWLVEDTFPDLVHDDPGRLRARVDLGELILLDLTVATHRPPKPFEAAERAGLQLVADPHAPVLAIDLREARTSGVRPLPARRTQAAYELAQPSPASAPAPDAAPTGTAELHALSQRVELAEAAQRRADERPASRIAHCLARGKTVLFVSEKLAALQVVHHRLENVGLAPYCLELHSRKAKKRAVLDQLSVALEHRPRRPPTGWQRGLDDLGRVRDALNAYVAASHGPRPLDRTVFEVTAELVGLRHAPLVPLALLAPEALDGATLRRIEEAGERLATATETVGEPAAHPFHAVNRGDLPAAELGAVGVAVDRLRARAQELTAARDGLAAALRLDALADGRRELEAIAALAELLSDAPGILPALLDEPSWPSLRADVDT